MTSNLGTIDWTAIGSIASGAMTFATLYTLRNNKKQFKELQKQSFESTLFQLLHETKKILSETTLSNLEICYSLLLYPSDKPLYERPTDLTGKIVNDSPTVSNVQKHYKNKIEGNRDLSSYFRSLYRVIKYINESNFSDKEKYKYTSFVRAQLSDIELLFLFYNCTVGPGKEKFKPLIEKWTLLKNIPKDRLFDAKHIEWIEDSAINRKQ